MRLAFLGTPEMAVPPLRALVAAGHDVVTVVTRADRRRGPRERHVAEPGQGRRARARACPVTHEIDDLLTVDADLGVVVAYGRIIKPHVLDALPMVNVHFSLLPRWRGAAPVERALLAGDDVTGVCIMGVEEGLDTGPVYARREVPIGPTTTADELRHELVDVGTELLVDVLGGAAARARAAVRRGHVRREDLARRAAADWDRPAVELDRWIRLGGAWTTFRGRRLKVHAAEPTDARGGRRESSPTTRRSVGTGDGSLRLVTRAAGGQAADVVGRLRQRCPATPGRDVRRSLASPAMPDEQLLAKVLTVSDGVAHGTRDDASGRALVEQLTGAGFDVVEHRVTEDGSAPVAAALTEMTDGFAGLVVTTGGTGFAPRDQTPEGTRLGDRAGGARAGRGDAPDQPVRPAVAWRRRRARPGHRVQHARARRRVASSSSAPSSTCCPTRCACWTRRPTSH